MLAILQMLYTIHIMNFTLYTILMSTLHILHHTVYTMHYIHIIIGKITLTI